MPYLPLLGRDGYIVAGWSHLISSFPRRGKTELLYQSIRAWLQAGHTVLYLSEEPRTVWRWRMRQRSSDWPRGMRVVLALGDSREDISKHIELAQEEIV